MTPAGATGRANNQAARQAMDALPLVARDQLQHASAALAAEIDQIHIHARKRRSRRLSDDLPIVEADQRDDIGDADPPLAQRIGDAARYLVVAAEDGVGARATRAEQRRHRLPPPTLGPD